MPSFSIPHLAPVRFVKELLRSDDINASVKVGFDDVPTLAMLIEAATQSSSGIKDDNKNVKMGFLVALKNVKQLKKITLKEYIIDVVLVHKLGNFKSLSFNVLDGDKIVVSGAFSVAIE